MSCFFDGVRIGKSEVWGSEFRFQNFRAQASGLRAPTSKSSALS